MFLRRFLSDVRMLNWQMVLLSEFIWWDYQPFPFKDKHQCVCKFYKELVLEELRCLLLDDGGGDDSPGCSVDLARVMKVWILRHMNETETILIKKSSCG